MRLSLLSLVPLLLTPAVLPLAMAMQGPQKPAPIPAPPDVAAPPKDAAVTASGLASKVIQAGTGTDKPGATDMVTVHYTGWTTDGKMFDSSVQRGEPAAFGLNRVIAGWTEGVQLMVVGEKTRFWIPQELAYKGAPGKPAGMLVFDVELLEILPDMPRMALPGGTPPGPAGRATPTPPPAPE